MSLTIVIPSYNEAENLKEFLPLWMEFCKTHNYKLIIINDGSTDETLSVLNSIDTPILKVLHHKVNRGYGAAIKSGIKNVDTDVVATMDADGQHTIDEIKTLYEKFISLDADMIIGKRTNNIDTFYRRTGKWLILRFAKILLPLKITDINSGMKIYKQKLASRYLYLLPDTMPFSDILALLFIQRKHFVIEYPISIKHRKNGKSTINYITAFNTLKEILNMILLFNPFKIFGFIGVLFILAGVLWGLPIVLSGEGVSVGAMLGIVTGILLFFMGLIAEQLAEIRKDKLD